MNKTKDTFERIRKKFPEQGQYVVNFAYNYPYFMKLNLREACHLIELRTVPQGHVDYRQVAQEMFNQINKSSSKSKWHNKICRSKGIRFGKI